MSNKQKIMEELVVAAFEVGRASGGLDPQLTSDDMLAFLESYRQEVWQDGFAQGVSDTYWDN